MIGKKVLQLKKKKKIISYTIGLRTFKDQEETLVIFERYLNNTWVEMKQNQHDVQR